MPKTGIFYLPVSTQESSPTQDIINRLSTHYNLSQLPSWTLSHRIFRETSSPNITNNAAQLSPDLNGADRTKATSTRYLQILYLSHHAPKTYVAITATTAPSQTRAGTPASSNISFDSACGEPATIASIPAGAQSEEFAQLIISKFGPLWQQRQMVHVGDGLAFEIDDFIVRIGEIRQGIGAVANQVGRGAVCEVQWNPPEDDGEDWVTAETVIKGFWEGLGIAGAKECLWAPGLSEGDGSVRQWCEILRTRS